MKLFNSSSPITRIVASKPAKIESISIWKQYLFPIVATFVTLLILLPVGDKVGGQPTLVFFTLPIMFSACLGGLRSGLLATFLTFLSSSYFLLPPIYSFAVDSAVDRYQQFFMILAGIFISCLSQALHRARQQAVTAVDDYQNVLAAAQESEIRMSGIVNSAMDAIITIDAQHRIILFNPSAEHVFGYSSEEILGQNINVLLPERFRADHDSYIQNFATTGVTSRSMGGLGTISGLHASGREIIIEASISQVNVSGQKLFTVILRDITAVKQAREEQERFFTLSLDLLCILDSTAQLLSVSPAFEKVLGFAPKDLIGKSALDFLHPDDLAGSKQKLEQLIEGHSVTDYVNRFRCLDGSYKSILWTAAPYGEQFYAAGRDITERLAAEATVRENEETFSAAFQSSSLSLTITDMDGRFVEANQAFCDLIQYSREEIIGSTAVDLGIVTAEARREILAALSRTGGSIDNLEVQLKVRDGSLIDVVYSTTFITLHGIEHRLASGLDITHRKRAEAELAQSQHFLQSTLDALASHITVLDETGAIIAVNKAWRTFSEENEDSEGVAIFCNVGDNYLDVCLQASGEHADQGMAVANGIREVMTGRQHEFCLEYPCHSPNGKRWFNVCITRFEGEGPTRIVVAHENISERKYAEEMQRKLEQQLRIVTQNARVGLVTVDSTRQYTFANAAYVEMLNLSSPDIVGKSLSGVLGSLYEEQIQPRLDRAFDGERVAYDLHRQVQGEDYYYAVRYEPLKVDGEILLVVEVITDITELKRAEAALQRAHDDLESRVLERTNEIQNVNESLRIEVIERKMAMDALREATEVVGATQKMLQLVIDHIPQAIFWKDRNSVYLGVNHQLALDAGYESTEQLERVMDFYKLVAWHSRLIQVM